MYKRTIVPIKPAQTYFGKHYALIPYRTQAAKVRHTKKKQISTLVNFLIFPLVLIPVYIPSQGVDCAELRYFAIGVVDSCQAQVCQVSIFLN